MHIKEYIFTNDTLKIIFDTSFSHIKLQKLERTNDPVVLDYDDIEMSFSKPKNTITLFTKSNDIVIIIVEVNKQSAKFSFRMKSIQDSQTQNTQTQDTQTQDTKTQDTKTQDTQDNNINKIQMAMKKTLSKMLPKTLLLKNENIFAQIRPKRHGII